MIVVIIKIKMEIEIVSMIQLKTFRFINAVSGTVFDMINVVYHDKPLIFIGTIIQSLMRLPMGKHLR